MKAFLPFLHPSGSYYLKARGGIVSKVYYN
jgi:hypothetical protein